MIVAADFLAKKPKQILVAGERGACDTKALLDEAYKRFLPHKVVFLADQGPAHRALQESMPVLKSIHQVGGKATVYVCEDFVCKLPTTDPAVVAKLLDE
jgi:uncharacterized protein YyaL (SSP411 family)